METAHVFAKLSTAERLQVGAIIVKENRIISIGYNGMPSGWSNECEGEDGLTKPEILHAESNAICKLAGSHESGQGATMFITHSPCLECSKLIYQSGIIEVYYDIEYRSLDGIKFLKKSGIKIQKMPMPESLSGR